MSSSLRKKARHSSGSSSTDSSSSGVFIAAGFIRTGLAAGTGDAEEGTGASGWLRRLRRRLRRVRQTVVRALPTAVQVQPRGCTGSTAAAGAAGKPSSAKAAAGNRPSSIISARTNDKVRFSLDSLRSIFHPPRKKSAFSIRGKRRITNRTRVSPRQTNPGFPASALPALSSSGRMINGLRGKYSDSRVIRRQAFRKISQWRVLPLSPYTAAGLLRFTPDSLVEASYIVRRTAQVIKFYPIIPHAPHVRNASARKSPPRQQNCTIFSFCIHFNRIHDRRVYVRRVRKQRSQTVLRVGRRGDRYKCG